MTRNDTLQAIEAEIKKNATTETENINRLSLLLNDALSKKLAETPPTTKDELNIILSPIWGSGDAISKKYIESIIADDTKNTFNIKG